MKTLAEAIEEVRKHHGTGLHHFSAIITESSYRDASIKNFFGFRFDPKCVLKVGDKIDDGDGFTATVVQIIADNCVFLAANRATSRFTIVSGFSCWEEFQGALQCGIMLPDGTRANWIAHALNEASAVRVMTGRGYKPCEELVPAGGVA